MMKRYLISEMDQNVKRMMKLIEEDGDSFAKKAEMYYKKRPELIILVEEFYRMYRSLAERYDHVTGELRKSVPSDIQSQGSCISDVCSSEPHSTLPSPPHHHHHHHQQQQHQRLSIPKPGPPRAAGFDFFNVSGSNNISELLYKDGYGDEESTIDSESESDESSVVNFVQINDEDQGLRRRILELELEIREMKAKHRFLQEEIFKGSQDEINCLRDKLRKYTSFDLKGKEFKDENGSEEPVSEIHNQDSDPEIKIRCLEDELSITKSKIIVFEKEIESIKGLKDQLGSSQKEISGLKSKLESSKREVSKLQDRISRYKSNLADRDQEIRGLKEAISNANKTLSEENTYLQAKINQLLKDKSYFENNIKEMDLKCQSLEEDTRRIIAGKIEMEAFLRTEIDEKNKNIEISNVRYDTLMAEKNELESNITTYMAETEEINEHLHHLRVKHVDLIDNSEKTRKEVEDLSSKVEELEHVIREGGKEKKEAIRQLCISIEHYRNGYNMLRKAMAGSN